MGPSQEERGRSRRRRARDKPATPSAPPVADDACTTSGFRVRGVATALGEHLPFLVAAALFTVWFAYRSWPWLAAAAVLAAAGVARALIAHWRRFQ